MPKTSTRVPVSTLVVDDEELARNLIASLVRRDPDLLLIGECSDGVAALVPKPRSSTLSAWFGVPGDVYAGSPFAADDSCHWFLRLCRCKHGADFRGAGPRE
jgi:hypothetical protein